MRLNFRISGGFNMVSESKVMSSNNIDSVIYLIFQLNISHIGSYQLEFD